MTLVHLIERNPPHQIHGEHHLSNPEEAERYLSELGRRVFAGRSASRPACACDRDYRRAHGPSPNTRPNSVPTSSSCARMARLACAHCCSAVLGKEWCGFERCPGLADPPGRRRHRTYSQRASSAGLLDGNVVDGQSLPLAVALAKVCGVELHLVVVVPTLRTLSGVGAASGLFMPATTRTILQLAHADASEYLSRQIAMLQAEDLHVWSGEVLRGEPSEIIVKTARVVAPDIIVLDIHDERGPAGFWSNNAVSKVASSTDVPLLLIGK